MCRGFLDQQLQEDQPGYMLEGTKRLLGSAGLSC